MPPDLRRTVESLTGELLSVYEELALLHSLSAKIGPLTEESHIAAVALREAMETLHADCGWIALREGENLRVPPACRAAVTPEVVERVNAAVLEPLRYCAKEQVVSDALHEEYAVVHCGAVARFLASCLPSGGECRGYLCLGRKSERRIFTSADQKLVTAVASLTAVALDNIRLRRSELEKARLEYELELARGVQQGLLPRDFACYDFLEAHGVSLPCYEIGGDYFDLLPIGRDQYVLTMADVSGKGPAAALQAAMLQGIVHASSREGLQVPALMKTINACIHERAVSGNFATFFAAILDADGRLGYSNAGHLPPLWIQAGGGVSELTEGGLVLGFVESVEHRQGTRQLARGDLLVLYTDGVTEAVNAQGEEFGGARVREWACRQPGRGPGEVCRDLIETVTSFCGAHRQADDLTVLVVRFTGRSAQ